MSRDPNQRIDLSNYRSDFSAANRVGRLIWSLVWTLAFRPSPTVCFAWRRFLLKLFGARIAGGAHVYPSTAIWAPWNLSMEAQSCLGPRVDCYNVALVVIGAHATVSQYSYLCTASHDAEDPAMELTTAPIAIGAQAWVCADVFVGPGVTVGEGCVVGARSNVFASLPPWMICHGSPARPVRPRVVRRAPAPTGT